MYYLDIGKKGEDKTVNFTNTYAETPSVTTFLLGASLDDIGAY